MNRSTLLGLLTLALSFTATRAASAQHRARCPQGQHESGRHHCCGPGEAWVDERNACICIEPAECHAAAQGTPLAGTGPTGPTPPPPPPAAPTCPEGMVLLNGGNFSMGSPSGDGEADESPQRIVTLSPFCIDRTEVTVAQYRSCAQAGTCTAPYLTVGMPNLPQPEVQFWSTFCNGARTDRDNHPVNCVDWTQASTYCRGHNNGSLPTEAQWEFAARGPEGRRFPWGAQDPGAGRLNACGSECPSVGERPGRAPWAVMYQDTDRFDTTAPVGSYAAGATPLGIMDLAGNVMEWTADWYGPYAPGPANNPTGPSSGAERVARGPAHWQSSNPALVRSSDRAHGAPTNRLATLGFRCVAPPIPAAPAAPPPPVPTGRH